MSIFLSFFGIPDLKLSTVLFTVLFIKLLIGHSIPPNIHMYQDIAVLPTKILLTEFLVGFMEELLTGLLQTVLD